MSMTKWIGKKIKIENMKPLFMFGLSDLFFTLSNPSRCEDDWLGKTSVNEESVEEEPWCWILSLLACVGGVGIVYKNQIKKQ